ncbi:RDD family protein [Algoriphagus sanaruensis]|uniref:RDD domain-containing protein n=1 Tax=Algoriphagus sanaruensis TaxID=1727163 RepID=A0A142EJF8_9BACT|nr:hypothetical protein AO498_02555 [Algoriphagus sanaruensis]
MKYYLRIIHFFIDSAAFLIFTLITVKMLENSLQIDELKGFLIFFYFFYYFISELLFGRTIGKLLTKTKVISIKNKLKPSFTQILVRTLCRAIPFYFLSQPLIGKGLHDHFSNTILIHT